MSNITVWFSCGVASAIAAKKTIELYPKSQIRIVNNPIKEEHTDNQRFLKDVKNWLNHKIEFAVNPKFPNQSCKEVWSKRKYMAGINGAPCTMELKKKARQHWESFNYSDYLVLGFTAEEKARADRFKLTERNNLLTPLIDEGITKQDCFDLIIKANIKPPEIYNYGFPNANCIGCVKASSPTYWNLVREKFPEVFKERAKQSRQIGAKLVKVKGKRIFLDELDPTTRGRSLKKYHIECGIFCEESGF